jgi:hypothetical protein
MAVIAIGLGIWMRADKTLLVTSNTEFYLDLPLLTCIGGGITFIVAFLGCVGALRENLVLLRVVIFIFFLLKKNFKKCFLKKKKKNNKKQHRMEILNCPKIRIPLILLSAN